MSPWESLWYAFWPPAVHIVSSRGPALGDSCSDHNSCGCTCMTQGTDMSSGEVLLERVGPYVCSYG